MTILKRRPVNYSETRNSAAFRGTGEIVEPGLVNENANVRKNLQRRLEELLSLERSVNSDINIELGRLGLNHINYRRINEITYSIPEDVKPIRTIFNLSLVSALLGLPALALNQEFAMVLYSFSFAAFTVSIVVGLSIELERLAIERIPKLQEELEGYIGERDHIEAQLKKY